MSTQAVRWALEEAQGVPTACVAVLVGLAWKADKDGRSAYPSEATLAAWARKSVRQVRRDLRELEKVGLIKPGNQAVVKGMRADRRPVVYDLPLGQNGGTHTTGRQRPPEPPRADTEGQTTGHTGSNGRTPTSANRADIGPDKSNPPRAHARAAQAEVKKAILQKTGKSVDDEYAQKVIDHFLKGQTNIRDPGRYVAKAIRNEPNLSRFLPVPMPPRYERDTA